MNYFYVNDLKINNIVKNQNIIDYLESMGILIPHYCYHKNLSVSGNCRMCLIELKNSPKPLVSCAMTINNKMELYTDSPLVKKARENVLEFLLLNHPLDCPVCDQGGECDLQDQSMVFGVSKKRFFKYKRSVTNKNIGPIVKTIMTRCIHCTRCVRFTSEIAGVDDLGTFNRGNAMEIGTYVSKSFQSELSGNIIDLCPVGALTSKPYSFVDRVWELKSAKSVDFSDGFGVETEISLKGSLTITKVAVGRNDGLYDNLWISDKTRFSFDGMFSPERLSNLLLTSTDDSKKLNTINSWNVLFKEISDTIYFKDHLNRHICETTSLTVLHGDFVSLECVGSLFLMSKKYPFLKIVKLADSMPYNDHPETFLLSTASDVNSLDSSNLCLLIGVNTRYEGFSLNLKLRQRFMQGNFEVFSLNSIIDFTFPAHVIGSGISTLSDIAQGNHFLCSKFRHASKPIIICGSELYRRKDAPELQAILRYLSIKSKVACKLKTNTWNGFNVLNTSLNETGVTSFTAHQHLTQRDLTKSDGLYFVETGTNNPTLKKLIGLKSLGYFNSESYKLIIAQTSIENNLLQDLKVACKSYSFINLPCTAFYETAGTYINTEGFAKKTVRVIASKYINKDSWQISRQISSSLGQVSLTGYGRHQSYLAYNPTTMLFLTSYLNLMLCPMNSFDQQHLLGCGSYHNSTNALEYRTSTIKVYTTKITQWLDDFYLSGKDPYSRISRVMIECSQMLRRNSLTFKYLPRS